jgi:hypothetical protein
MYQVDTQDVVVDLVDVPSSEPGAPLPAVVAAEHKLELIYLASEPDPDWDGTYARVMSTASSGEPVAVVKFGRPYEEAFSGHPLAQRGVYPGGAFEVQHSSWLRALERMNSVHRYHTAAQFAGFRHFIFAFHDSTFECIAKSYTCELRRGSVASVAAMAPQTW